MCVITFGWEHTDAKKKFENFDARKSLSWVVLELTDACNLNCKWCYASSNSDGQHMPLENAKKILADLKASGVRQVTLSGGEPLIYPHIKEVTKAAADHGFVVHMNTNGWLLTEELAQELRQLGLSQVQINIDSIDPKKHDEIRGREGSFERAILALKNARNAGLVCTVQTVLTKENENAIIDIFKFARSLGIQRCRVWDMTPAGRAKEQMAIRPTDYVATLKALTRFAEETGAVNIESGDPLFPLDFRTTLSVTGGYCVAKAGFLTNIGSNGDVYFCVTDRTPMFNAFIDMPENKTFEEHYMKKLNEYNQKLKIPERCLTCKKCNGGCSTRSKFSERDYFCRL
jgi:radical SAM protein with 4Fe4S-binding SPASM domain